MDYVNCLNKMGYVVEKVFKDDSYTAVVQVMHMNNSRVVKVLRKDKVNDKLVLDTFSTEIQALKYLTKINASINFFPNYMADFSCNNNDYIIMEYIPGNTLQEYNNKKMDIIWWKSLIYQLIVVVYILEDHRILHNDFWDANIIIYQTKINDDDGGNFTINYDGKMFTIPNAGFLVKIIDFQYMNSYTLKPKIVSNYVMSTGECYAAEKKRLGWSSKFHKGGDLNQILGILSDYRYIPPNIKTALKKIVKSSSSSKLDFPYAIDFENPKTTAAYLAAKFAII